MMFGDRLEVLPMTSPPTLLLVGEGRIIVIKWLEQRWKTPPPQTPPSLQGKGAGGLGLIQLNYTSRWYYLYLIILTLYDVIYYI